MGSRTRRHTAHVNEYTCAYCQAVFEEERQLLAHFCPEREAAEKAAREG